MLIHKKDSAEKQQLKNGLEKIKKYYQVNTDQIMENYFTSLSTIIVYGT